MPEPSLIPASDHSLLIQFGGPISLETHRVVLALFRKLQSEQDLALAPYAGGGAKILNLHPGYTSLLVTFNPLLLTHEDLILAVSTLLPKAYTDAEQELPGRQWEIPVCYGGDLGPDLAEVAELHGMSEKEVIFLHSRATYRVYFLGFSPGFPYLGGLPSQIATPRLETPRKHVAAGSVAIGGEQAGIYPVDSPGGWRIIGRTPERLFTPELDQPTLLLPGDIVRFVPISWDKWASLTHRERAAA